MHKWRDTIKRAITTGLGTGYLPVAPGTWASAAVAAVFLLAAWGWQGRWYCTSALMGAIAISSTAACVALGRFTEETFGRKDPSQCTIDEWAGQAVALFLLPMGSGWPNRLIVAAAGFLTFRLFDIIKPPPARRLERLPRGLGIVADDLVAGIYANLAARVILSLLT